MGVLETIKMSKYKSSKAQMTSGSSFLLAAVLDPRKMCISSLRLCNKLPKTQRLKTVTDNYDLV